MGMISGVLPDNLKIPMNSFNFFLEVEKMKNVLCLVVLTLLCALSAPAVAVTVGSGGYTDDYSTDKYLTDAYSNTGWVRNVTENRLDTAAAGPAIKYAITRTNYATAGVVQFDTVELGSGDGSWIWFGTGASADGIGWNNMTNYMGPCGSGLIRLQLPAGQQTTYFGVGTNAWEVVAEMDNLAISDDGSMFNALASKALNIGNTTWSATMANVMTENYKMVGGVHRNNSGSTIELGNNNGNSMSYRIGGDGKAITDGTINFAGYDYTSGDASWLNILIYDLAGNQIYWNNLANLGGNGAKTLDIAAISGGSLIGSQGFDIKFEAQYAGNIGMTAFGVNINAIPEPATMVLLGIGGLALLRRRTS